MKLKVKVFGREHLFKNFSSFKKGKLGGNHAHVSFNLGIGVREQNTTSEGNAWFVGLQEKWFLGPF